MKTKKGSKVVATIVSAIILVELLTIVMVGILYKKSSSELETVEDIVKLVREGKVTEKEIKSVLSFFANTGHTDMRNKYKNKYKSLYVDNTFEYKAPKKKTCYLTFDDGPTDGITDKILDVLKRNNVKATFFVTRNEGARSKGLYRRIVNEGHTIAVHTNSHDYEKIYRSVEAYLEDFYQIQTFISNNTGQKPEIFRFPGGSINSYNVGIYKELIAEMLRRGYTYYDWNVSSGDADGINVSVGDIKNNILSEAKYEYGEMVALMHDGAGHTNTAKALPSIIKGLKEQGYCFAPLTKEVRPTSFGYW